MRVGCLNARNVRVCVKFQSMRFSCHLIFQNFVYVMSLGVNVIFVQCYFRVSFCVIFMLFVPCACLFRVVNYRVCVSCVSCSRR